MVFRNELVLDVSQLDFLLNNEFENQARFSNLLLRGKCREDFRKCLDLEIKLVDKDFVYHMHDI